MSNIMTLIEFGVRMEERPQYKHVLLCDIMTSTRQLIMCVSAFEILTVMMFPNVSATLHLCVHEGQYKEMFPIVSDISSVMMHKNSDWSAVLADIKTQHQDEELILTMIMNNIESIAEFKSVICMQDVFLNITLSMTEFRIMHEVSTLIRERGMVREVVLCSDPSLNMVRITNGIVSQDQMRVRLTTAMPIEMTNGFMSMINNRIRPMDLNGMCFDCRMMSRIGTAILSRISTMNTIESEIETEDWSRSFAETVTIDLEQYVNPT